MKFTTEQRDAAVSRVQAEGERRAQSQGSRFNEVDYVCGAMAIFFALECQDMIPAGWIFGPLGGRSALGIDRSTPDRLQSLEDQVCSLNERAGDMEHRLAYLEEADEEILDDQRCGLLRSGESSSDPLAAGG